ncbi:inhibin beta chain [Drosophila tropicalis]|uniref:inhibin beta chain n=1 Tax=Drosophila tropicalis TaxID=46794 RepID=UPI0035AC05E8
MRFDFEQQQAPSLPSASRCFYNCPCFCCRQGCCVVVVGCCSCLSLNCSTGSSSSTSSRASHCPPLMARKKVPVPLLGWFMGISKLLGTAAAFARWTTALATLLTSCIILELDGGIQQSTPSDSRSNNKPVSVTVPTTATTKLKVQMLYGHVSYDIANNQQLKSNNLCKMFCNSRKRQRQCPTLKAFKFKVINDTDQGSELSPVWMRSTADPDVDVRVSSLKDLVSSWPVSTNGTTIRHCAKNKRNRANLVWLLIGLVWLEVKLINCNAIGSGGGSGYISNIVAHRGCTMCHEEGKGNFYSDKDNPHTDYNNNNNNNNNNNKYNNNNYYYKKTNRNHYNIAPSDRVRLESIKRQILTKLGLTQKPNVSHPLPKQFIWETINRADGGRMVANDGFDKGNNGFEFDGHDHLHEQRVRTRHMHPDDSYLESSELNTFGTFQRNRSATQARHAAEELNQISPEDWPEVQQLHYRSYHSHNQADATSRTANRQRSHDSQNRNRKSNSNAYSKSTYLIDINRSSDSSINRGIHGSIGPNDYVYFNDYSGSSSSSPTPSHSSSRRPMNVLNDGSGIPMPEQDLSDREDFFGNTQEIITFAEEGTQYRKYRIVEFAPQRTRVPNQRLSIRSAELHIRVDKQRAGGASGKSRARLQVQLNVNSKRKPRANVPPQQRIKIWVFQLSAGINITEKGTDQAFLFRTSFEVNTKHMGWQKFDLTETIREWYSEGSTGSDENLRLLIDCTGCGNHYSLHLSSTKMKTRTESGDANLNPYRPFLVIHTESTRTRRVRRRAVDCGGALSGQCCKESFYVSFKALGWDDWIIAPRGYFANYCRGDCTGPFRTPDTFQTFHAHFIEEYRKMGLLNGMRPCCAPVKFSSMSLIYYGDDGIIKRDLPKMVVDECGCP